MSKVKLDRIDRRILHSLQANGRITNVELARHAGISAPPCLRRVRALEETGSIRGYHADIDPEALGFGVTVERLPERSRVLWTSTGPTMIHLPFSWGTDRPATALDEFQ